MEGVKSNNPGLHEIFDLFGSQLIDKNDTIFFPIMAIDHRPQRSTT
jgi:hypothetical protein